MTELNKKAVTQFRTFSFLKSVKNVYLFNCRGSVWGMFQITIWQKGRKPPGLPFL